MHDAVERVLAERAARRGAWLRTVGLTGAVLLHAAVVAAAVVVPRLTQEEREPLEFVAVTIVPAAALGGPRTPSRPDPEPETAPEPVPNEPEPEPERPEPETEAPPPLPEKEPEPKKREPKPEARRRPAEPAPGRDRGTESGSPRGTGTSSFGLQVTGVGDPTFTYGYYLDRMLALIERNWRRPPTDGARPEVSLDFTIRRDGTVEDLEVAESSGINAFDLAGFRAVQTASPLPPLPAGYRKDSLSIRLIIR